MSSIKPKNLTAQLSHRARGNPESTQPISSISNCFPGLEFDFKNTWKNIFVEVELHEGGLTQFGHAVLGVVPGSDPDVKGVRTLSRFVAVDGLSVSQPYKRPNSADSIASIELSNALAAILAKQGQTVTGTFETEVNNQSVIVNVDLTVRELFDLATLSEELAEPGALSQGLCSPWQADYRECGCSYWAASRPDFVNADIDSAGNTTGHNWMQADRPQGGTYQGDLGGHDTTGTFVTYDDLYTRWEEVLRFVIKGKDIS